MKVREDWSWSRRPVRLANAQHPFSNCGFVFHRFGSAAETIVSRDAKVDNIRIHYLTAGKGPAVILLHGFAETSRMWRPLIPLLAEKFLVIARICRASGDSSHSRRWDVA